MGRSGRAVLTATWLVAALISLVACGGGGGEAGDAGRSATTLPSASDRPSDRDTDPPSQTLDQENPQRFIARWAAAEARMENTGKTGAYLRLSKGCAGCRTLAHTVEGYYAAGGFIKGGAWRIDSIKTGGSSNGYPIYTVRAHTTPSRVRESSSSRVLEVPGGPVTYQVGLLARGSSYTVAIRTRGN